jgi:hypothetical protein
MPFVGLRRRAAALAACVVPLASCSLVVGLDGLTGGNGGSIRGDGPAGSDGGGTTLSPVDARAADGAVLDAAHADAAAPDSGAPFDAGGNPGADAGCFGLAGRALAFGAPTTTGPPFGGDGGAPYDDPCPAGAALVALSLVEGSPAPFSISQLAGVCAPVHLDAQCRLILGAPATLANHGLVPGAARTLTCPAGEVAVGLRTSSRLLVDAIALDCAPLTFARAASGGVSVAFGGITVVGPFGGDGGAADPPFDCPSPTVVARVGGGSADWIDRLEVTCSTPRVQ